MTKTIANMDRKDAAAVAIRLLGQAPGSRLAITPGEPAGIGPDLCVQLAQEAHGAELVAVADPGLLMERARRLGLPLHLEEADLARPPAPQAAGSLKVLPVQAPATVSPGRPTAANAPYVLETLRLAARGCLEGDFAALVTAPVHKGVINEAGIPFSGHTEFLAELAGVPRVVMMLATPGLRVALVTTHLPLRAVCDAITPQRLTEVLRITHRGLRRDFGLARPRLLVCGLNPHAGEEGHLGREEMDIIIPVLETLRGEGLALEGPLPADSLFIDRYLETADAVVAMYHDQGLPVLKHMGFGRAVNITLGLPFVRTSVDHGTALTLAGTGRASVASLALAVDTALGMAAQRARHGEAGP